MDLRFIEIPKIDNDILLEELCMDLLKSSGDFTNVNMHGRPGQKQDGVDVYARKKDSTGWIGAQCKLRSTNRSFSKAEIMEEINKAKLFNPKLSEYFLYTTLDRDGTTQEIGREISNELALSGDFTFEIKFWADIAATLKVEQYLSVYFKYYRKFFRDNTSFGHSVGKLMNVELGFGHQLDTHYEIILGKIPTVKTEKTSVDYYRGTYFLVNLHEKKIEFFTPHKIDTPPYCHDSDLEHAFDNAIDLHRIVKWVNAIKNLDEFIYDDNYTSQFYLSFEERKEFERYREDEE